MSLRRRTHMRKQSFEHTSVETYPWEQLRAAVNELLHKPRVLLEPFAIAFVDTVRIILLSAELYKKGDRLFHASAYHNLLIVHVLFYITMIKHARTTRAHEHIHTHTHMHACTHTRTHVFEVK